MSDKERFTVAEALSRLPGAEEDDYGVLLEHGSLEVGIYRPRGEDRQQPHTRDEVYVVISGAGRFVVDGESRPFEAGEVLFVPAGAAHRFEGFGEDFATWVFFYGPEGGEGGSEVPGQLGEQSGAG